jgi:hypothetical protein
MYAAELLRDCAKCVRDDARAYFHHAQHACDKQREFGARLRTLSEKAERNTKGIIHVPSGNGTTPSQSPRPVPPDAACRSPRALPSATALEQPFLEDDDSVHPLDLNQPGVTEPLLEEVLGTTRMVSKLANAQMDGAERYAKLRGDVHAQAGRDGAQGGEGTLHEARKARPVCCPLRTTSLFLSLTFTVDPSRRSSVLGRCPVRI